MACWRFTICFTTPDSRDALNSFDADGNPIVDRTLENLPDLRNGQ